MRRWAKRLAIGLPIAVLLILVAIGAAGYGLLHSDAGKRQLAGLIERALGEGTDVELGDFAGWPTDLRLDRLVIRDQAGAWLTLENARVAWAPSALLGGRLHIEALSADRLAVERLPAGEPEEPPAEPSGGFELPELPAPLRGIALDRLTVGRLALGAPLLGEAAAFRIDGGLVLEDPKQRFDLRLAASRLDEPTANLTARASLVPRQDAPPVLTVALEARETGGLLSAVTGAPQDADLALSLNGRAPVNDWHGVLAADADGFGRIEAEIGLMGAVDLSSFTASADGRLTIAPGFLPEAQAALIGPEGRFAVRLRRPETQDILILEQANFAAGPAAADVKGRFDPTARTVDADVRVTLAPLSALEGLAGRPLAGKLTAVGHVSGPLSRPGVTLDLTADDLRTEGASLARLTANLRLAAETGQDGAAPGWRLEGDGDIAGLSVDGASLPERDFTWSVAAALPARGPITVSELRLAGSTFGLTASGSMAPTDRAFTAEATLDVKDLQRLAGAASAGLPPSPRLRLRATGSFGEALAVDLDGRLDRLRPLPPALAALVGESIDFAASAELTAANRLGITDLHIAAAAARLTGHGQLDLRRQDLQATFDLAVPALAVLEPAIGTPLAGSFAANAAIGGSLSVPTLTVEAVGKDIRYREQRFERISAEARARDLLAEPAGRLRLALPLQGQDYELTSGFRLKPDRLSLPDLALKAPATDIAGALSIGMQDFLVEGGIKGNSSDLAALGRLAGQEMGGRATLELRLSPIKGRQTIAVTLTGRDLVSPYGQLGRVRIQADVDDAFADPHGEAAVRASGLHRGEVAVEALSLDLRGDLDKLTFEADANGTLGDPFRIETGGALAILPGGGRVDLSELSGSLAGESFMLAAPATLQFASGVATIDGPAVQVAGGRLAISGRYGAEAIDLKADVDGLPLALASRFGGPPVSGQAGAGLRVSGTPAAPRVELDVELGGVKPAGQIHRDVPPMDLTVNASLRDDRLDVRLQAQGLFETPITGQAALPMELSLEPFSFRLPRSERISGEISGEGDLGRLVSLLLLDDQLLDGRVDVDLGFGGTLGSPQLNGAVAIENGQYQNLATGTVLRDVQATLAAQGTELVIQHFSATDGGKGTADAKGRINFALDQGLPVALKLVLSDMALLRQDDVLARMGGELALDGSLAETATLRGVVTVGPAEIRLPDRLPPSVVNLDVTYIDEQGKVVPEPQPEPGPVRMDKLALDLKVDASRIFVRGRGLESEWGGALHIAGTAAAPSIEGQLEVRRGFLDFIGRRLDLTSGAIRFSGATPPEPVIDVVSTTGLEGGVKAQIILRGDVKSPELVVTSQPELPQDEVLAQLLFGRALSGLTPIQAVKLAAAVNTLRGGGGFDLMGEARELLGVDVLNIEQGGRGGTTAGAGSNGGGGTTVAAGKYVSENVYVEAKQGVAARSGAVSVEIEVTPNVTVSTEVGANSQAGVGVKWEWNY